MDDELIHYGTSPASGRYPKGSGDDPYQRSADFITGVTKLRRRKDPKTGKRLMSDTDIARSYGLSTGEFRAREQSAKNTVKLHNIDLAKKLRYDEDGNIKCSIAAISRRLDAPASTVKTWLKEDAGQKAVVSNNIKDTLKAAVSQHTYIDVSHGVENWLGVSKARFNNAVEALKNSGEYNVHLLKVKQAATGHETSINVLTPKDVTWPEAKHAMDYTPDAIKRPFDDESAYLVNHCREREKVVDPVRVDLKRVQILYDEDGGSVKDGVIELRRGVPDLSLGSDNYSQVRIAIGDRYAKGMAVYADDLPDGIDIRVNSHYRRDQGIKKALKEMKDLSEEEKQLSANPFGATVKQSYYIDPETGEKKLSAINKVNAEGEWSNWSKELSTQVLSKQPVQVAQKQLTLTYQDKRNELDEIMSLTNPEVKQMCLESFARQCDSDATDLRVNGLPGQASHVILPLTTLSDKQVYAPNYPDGTKVVLIRYPHGGIFEIPELTVNNSNREGRRVIGPNARDAIGINPKVGKQLSGADFDGDSVLVIPNRSNDQIGPILKTAPYLKKLIGFDPNIYELPGGKTDPRHISLKDRGMEMGKITNLICDMQALGASIDKDADDIVNAVKYSMVAIDAWKHDLDYKRAYEELGIAEINAKWRGDHAGASTIFSRASGDKQIPEIKEGMVVKDRETGAKKTLAFDPETGEKYFTETGRTFMKQKTRNIIDPETGKPMKDPKTFQNMKEKVFDADGNPVMVEKPKTTTVSGMDAAFIQGKDAFSLVSDNGGTPTERVYADYANKLIALANEARKATLTVGKTTQDKSVALEYADEIASLDRKLDLAQRNAPLERKAQMAANVKMKMLIKENPGWTAKERSEKSAKWLTFMRERFGAGKNTVTFTDREWEAVQRGAISHTKLVSLLNNANMQDVKQHAMPRSNKYMSAAKIQRAREMMNNGNYTSAQIAETLGVSTTVLQKAMYGDEDV